MPCDLGSKGVECRPKEHLRGLSEGALQRDRLSLPDARASLEAAGKWQHVADGAAAGFLEVRTSTWPGRAKGESALPTSVTWLHHQPSPEDLEPPLGRPSKRRWSR